jgi:hypothetical protein
MAITRAQIAKQLLAQGGRIGLKGGADAATASFGKSVGYQEGPPGVSGGTGRPDKDFKPGTGGGGPTFGDTPATTVDKNIVKQEKAKYEKQFFDRGIVPPLGSRPTSFKTKLNQRNLQKRLNYINYLQEQINKKLQKGLMDPSIPGVDVMTEEELLDLAPSVQDLVAKGFYKSDGQFAKGEKIPDFPSMDMPGPCKGPNPPAYCFTGIRSAAPVVEEPEYVNPLSLLTPRIAGSQFTAADGGMASLEDMDREGFLLGGIAKGLKKAVRGVKKLAKSPIGKAALGAALFKFGGGLGGLKGKLFGLPGVDEFGGTMGLFGKLKLTGGFGSYMPTALGGITLASLAAGAMTPKEDEDKIDSYYASGQLNPSLSSRMMGSEFDFYGGERMRVAEGGSTEKEPVAKKTMPLLDMDGMEKDYREEGGFVPIGRMEKADDVPARLSKNEFVFTADAVRNAGDGDVDKGAEVMYNMMKNLESGGDVSEESQGLEGAREMFQTSQRLGEVI